MAKDSQWSAAAGWIQGGDAEVRQRLRTDLDRLENADAFQTLGLDYRAERAEIRAAFLAMTKEYHPNRFARRERDVVRLANEVFLRIKKAYNDLATDTARERSLAKLGRAATVSARVLPPAPDPIDESDDFAETPGTRPGAVRFKVTKLSEPPTSRAVPLPDVAQQSVGSEAKFQRAMELCGRHLWSEAREALQKLALDEPQNKQYRAHMHYSWGREYVDLGQIEQARAEYRRALVADPGFIRAKQSAEALPEEEKPKDRGFFSRLFRK